MPVSKVDARCFNLSQRVDDFLSLGNANRTDLTPTDFWKEIVQSEEAVSSYIVCLMVKLIALDSDHGLKPLPMVYKDLVEMSVDHSKYKQWSAKPLPANCKSAALELQYAIITTIRHLKDCYGYAPNIHLRHMYLRWNLARNFVDGKKKADEFEEKVISPFSVAQAKEVIRSPVNSPIHKSFSPPLNSEGPTPEEEEQVLVRRLVDECYANHRRAFFGGLLPDQCKLCTYTNATDCLSYIRLRDLTTRSPRLLDVAMTHVLMMLKGEVSHSQDYGEKEVLLPLLHLFREFLIMMCPVDSVDVYQTVMSFYMWPLSHSQYTRGVLDQIMQEGRVRGTNYRRRLLAEQDLCLKPTEKKVRGHLIHMLVDTSHPLSRGSLLQEIFSTHQQKSDQQSLQRLLIRNVLKSVSSDMDLMEMEAKLKHLSSDSLKAFSVRCLEMVEKASSGRESVEGLKGEAETIYKEIVQHADSDEQRDSAVSCSSVDSDFQDNQHLSSFPLPQPFIHMHSLDNTQYPTILNRMRELLIMSRQKMVAGDKGFTQSMEDSKPPYMKSSVEVRVMSTRNASGKLSNCPSSSHTSLDSTGSSVVEQEKMAAGEDERGQAETPELGSGDGKFSREKGTAVSGNHVNGLVEDARMVNGVNGHATDYRDHASSPDDGSMSRKISVGDGDRHRPTSLQCLDGQLVEQKNDDSSSRLSTDTTPSFDKSSIASSESGSTPDTGFTPPSPSTMLRNVVSPASRPPIGRRQTCPSGMQHVRNSALLKASSTTSSSFTNSPSNPKRYANVSGMGSRPPSSNLKGVKLRRNTSRAGMILNKKTGNRRKVEVSSSNPATKVVKVVLAGNDFLVSHTAKAYAYLQMEEPNLLNGLELRFYHVPLSRASLIHTQFPELAQANLIGSYMQGGSMGGGSGTGAGGPSDLPEPMFEQVDFSGNDVHLGRYLAHMDSWYERNLMMAVHHLLRLIPSDLPPKKPIPPVPEVAQRPMSPIIMANYTVGEVTQASRTNLTPSKVLIEAITNYTREATNTININIYRLKMNIKSEKSHKMEHREVYMLHRLDIQRLSGKKAAHRQVKTFEANLKMTQLSLDGSLIQSDMMEIKDVWLLHASNVPRAGDSCVPNPESKSLEFTVLKAQAEGGRFGSAKFRASEESQYHVCDMVIETRDKPFTVMVDSDTDVLIENVVRLEVSPACRDQSSILTPGKSGGQKLQLPLMTYWPVDL